MTDLIKALEEAEGCSLIFGDCISEMKMLPSNSVDAIMADTPYGTTRCKWDTIIPLAEMWSQVLRVTKPNAPIILFAASPYDKVLGASNLQMLKYEWIWEKSHGTGHFNAKKMPMKCHENILVFYKKPPKYNPQMTFGHTRKTATKRKLSNGDCYGENTSETHYDSTARYPRSVIKFASDKQKGSLHSTQKPIKLMEYLIKTYTGVGDVVLDFCMGSGTTGMAALSLNRLFVGIDNDHDIYKVAVNRIAALRAREG